MDGTNSSFGDLTTHFFKWEFRCPCKKCRRKKVRVDDLLLFKLEMLRNNLGHKPIIIISGNRCVEYNESVHGHPLSAHIPSPAGQAADIKVKGIKPIDIGLAAEKVGGFRIGIGKGFVHLDVRKPSPSRFWIYKDNIIYSAKIENESLLKFYQIVKGDE